MNILIQYGSEINALLALACVMALSIPRRGAVKAVWLCLAGAALCLVLTLQAVHTF